jgi:hypothetical protein
MPISIASLNDQLNHGIPWLPCHTCDKVRESRNVGGIVVSATTASILVAILSAIVSVGTATGLEYSRRRSSREIESLRTDQQRELERFKTDQQRELEKFRNELTISREVATKAEEALRIVARYRDPLLRSAFDLQSRLYNVLRPGGFRGGRSPEYFRLSTLFVIAEFFGWLEIIRRDMQFLDLGATGVTRELNTRIAHIQDCFAATTKSTDEYYIYRAEQRAIGELMISPTSPGTSPGPRSECLGYATFVMKNENPRYSQWFERLSREIQRLPERKSPRLVKVQHALIDLLDLLDPELERFPSSRSRLQPLTGDHSGNAGQTSR